MAEIETLIEAAKTGDLGKVRALLAENFLLASQRLPNGESPLMTALYRGHGDVVDALIEAGAEIDVFAAAATGRTPDLERDVTRPPTNAFADDGGPPPHRAVFFGHGNRAPVLRVSGADVRGVARYGLKTTPLRAATAGRHSDVALALLRAGANPS